MLRNLARGTVRQIPQGNGAFRRSASSRRRTRETRGLAVRAPGRMSAQGILATVVAVFGAVCCVIAFAHILIGPAAIPGSIAVNANMDSEHRFYAALFLGFGAALIWCSRDLQARSGPLGCLLLVFFLGGIARMVSAFAVGLPSLLFVMLGALELLLPPVLWAFHRSATASPYLTR